MVRQGPPEVSTLNVYLGLKAWAAEDPVAANAWYEKNKQTLNPLEQLSTIKAFTLRSLEVGEFDGARAWAEQIPEPSLRDSFLKQIEAKEAALKATE